MEYISENLVEQKHAGSKARIDVEKILESQYKPYAVIDQSHKLTLTDKIKTFYALFLKQHHEMKAGEVIIAQFPFAYKMTYRRMMTQFVKKRDVIFLIHDIESLRQEQIERIPKEIKLLNYASAIIVHNDFMIQKLQKLGVVVPCVSLGLFDYLVYHGIPTLPRHLGNDIAFAGNLGKSTFLSHLPEYDCGVRFYLYGINLPDNVKNNPNVNYKGSYSADEIPYHLDGSFGLVWDGPSTGTCEGSAGRYMKYNNPHKLSLYIASGLPVIVWKQAAIANFVEDNHIGFTINGLEEIKYRIASITDRDYEIFTKNITNLQRKVLMGDYTRDAIEKALILIKGIQETKLG